MDTDIRSHPQIRIHPYIWIGLSMFNKNKKKLDRRVVYQTRGFKNQLRSARAYKRPQKVLPKNSAEVFLSKIGLGSWLSRWATLLAFFLLIYIVFVPNFLFIKLVNVNGADAATNADAKTLAASYLNKNLPWPQKNLILNSKYNSAGG